MKVGIFGGSFNPVHNSHIELCKYVTEKTGLDRILLIPTGDNPLKKTDDGIDRMHRLNMVLAACEGEKNIFVSDIEIMREGASYTVDTVRALKRDSGDEYYFIFGADIMFQLSSWKNFDELSALVGLIAVRRSGIDYAACINEAARLSFEHNARITLIDDYIPREISSSMIRLAVKNKKDISGYVPESVFKYIKNNKLYEG